jgi:glucose-1-phosphate thymidylyltransferase|tara:strand:- start:10334 stop:11062 length:729 start_codon:yes stop_codon:yes gene_type:complete
MDSIILAGGFAKRMWPLTKNTPKQLLDVAGKPMLTHVLESLERIKPERVILSVNSFFSTNFERYVKNYSGPLNLELFVESSNNEEEKLGALGALNLLFSEYSIKGPVFIAGGDNLSNFDLNEMIKKYLETKKDVIGLYDVEDIELAKLYGIAGTKNDSIIDFYEKPNEPKSTLAATAYWLLSESGITNFFNYINSGGDRDALGNFLAWNIQEADVKSVSFRGVWYDIGDLESYNTAQKWLSN